MGESVARTEVKVVKTSRVRHDRCLRQLGVPTHPSQGSVRMAIMA